MCTQYLYNILPPTERPGAAAIFKNFSIRVQDWTSQQMRMYVTNRFYILFQVIKIHLIHHLPTWVYPYERFNSWYGRQALSRKHPVSGPEFDHRLPRFEQGWTRSMTMVFPCFDLLLTMVDHGRSSHSKWNVTMNEHGWPWYNMFIRTINYWSSNQTA